MKRFTQTRHRICKPSKKKFLKQGAGRGAKGPETSTGDKWLFGDSGRAPSLKLDEQIPLFT
ncbi:hypothetical protein ACPPVU_12605 [Mucilaginibacter sp. McL0603]|uniref:hypothetical protein n=1 Tax=Mucilaginibacter sp. McL0603 TaxID=3415670 RepID=UPI003CF08ED2